MPMTFRDASKIVRLIRHEIRSNLDDSFNPIDEKRDQILQKKLGDALRQLKQLRDH